MTVQGWSETFATGSLGDRFTEFRRLTATGSYDRITADTGQRTTAQTGEQNN